MRAVAKGLLRLVPTIDVLATSPLMRTVQTAEIIFAAYGAPRPVVVDVLAPDSDPAGFLRWLRKHATETTVAAVGHDPALPHLAGLLMSGAAAPLIAMKKGGACMLGIDGPIGAGAAVLQWALAPAHLRDIGR